MGSPFKLSGILDIDPIPRLSEHNQAILQELLDYSEEDIAGLKEKGIL